MSKWDYRFLELAKHVSSWSLDPSTKVGAVIIDQNKHIISMGYNGLPQKLKDDPLILNDRDMKLKKIIHAEMNALIFAQCSINGYTLCTYPFLPCTNCCSMFIQAGIARVIAPINKIERWEANLALTREMLNQASVEFIEYDLK